MTDKKIAPGDRTHCPHGHEYTPENTKLLPQKDRAGAPNGRFRRQCVQCKKEWKPAATRELKAAVKDAWSGS